MEAVAHAPSAAEEKSSQKIPDALIYEIVDGRPIYYRGYREVLNGNLTLEAVMAESSLQAWLKAQLSFLLMSQLAGKSYEVLTGELGLFTGGGNRRGADIALYRSEDLVLDAHFSKTAPEVIIEIDTQIDLKDENEMEYVLAKIDDYLRFGVKQVIWIFTFSQKIMTATPVKPWLTLDWNATIVTIEGASFSLEKMLEGKKIG